MLHYLHNGGGIIGERSTCVLNHSLSDIRNYRLEKEYILEFIPR